MRKKLVTPKKTYALTTGEAVAVLVLFVAIMVAVAWALSTMTTHTLAVFAVFLLIFRTSKS
jgi:hypothetical protein